ncbi:MAG: RNA polymerase sigma factor [Acidobacteria bacterium]|nr:RNA polymerase sigma factor [Acidobacteriota bacterium]
MTGDVLTLDRIESTTTLADVFREHNTRMKSVAYNLLGSQADAEDAVQEAFLKAHRSLAAFRGGSTLSTWVYRTLLNVCLDEGRRRARRPEAVAEPAVDSKADLRAELRRALAAIDARQRAVFLLAAVEGFTHAEISGMLAISEANSRTILLEARRKLQERLTAK